ncbi:MerR family transcriptional regulator [Actinoplanes sp. LDG1-06]|uniref:MerR family transcriptional regulator n=1 Tax=Paractinoplanes ovalisporus TaxID=2810368 RepID=A0ABS2AA17_9ACTN|nr:MerR family transcriptional regulator [Actinoplanes ovalisporus]MBM2616163.1 MerR family transcriptional regulator [Actinoplanes ovalisporus]
MRIGELAQATGVSTRALRYYDQQGLLPTTRSPNGYRTYTPQAVDIVAFIQDLYRAGLPSEIIRDILPCALNTTPDGDCNAMMTRVLQVRDELQHQEDRLRERRETLESYLTKLATPSGLIGS